MEVENEGLETETVRVCVCECVCKEGLFLSI